MSKGMVYKKHEIGALRVQNHLINSNSRKYVLPLFTFTCCTVFEYKYLRIYFTDLETVCGVRNFDFLTTNKYFNENLSGGRKWS